MLGPPSTLSSIDVAISAQLGTDKFINAGLFEKTLTTNDTTNVEVGFVNTGLVSVQTGTLVFGRGGSSSASAFTVAAGAAVAFDDYSSGASGTFTITGGTYNVAGETEIGGGKADFSSATITSFGSELLVSGSGLLELGTQSGSVASLDQTSGFIDGTGTLTVAGVASLTSVQTGSGTTLLKGGSSVSSLYLDGGRVLENQGTLTATGSLFLGENEYGLPSVGGGTVKNDAGATFDLQSVQGGVSLGVASSSDTFVNAGLFEQTVTTDVNTIQVAFNNTGLISVQSGTLWFLGAVTGSGNIEISAGATAEFGNLTELGGTITIANGGTLSLNGTESLSGAISGTGELIQSSGTITIASGNTLTVAGTDLISGSVGGAGKLAITAGNTKFNAGASLSMASWSISGTANVTLVEAVDLRWGVSPCPAARLALAQGPHPDRRRHAHRRHGGGRACLADAAGPQRASPALRSARRRSGRTPRQ